MAVARRCSPKEPSLPPPQKKRILCVGSDTQFRVRLCTDNNSHIPSAVRMPAPVMFVSIPSSFSSRWARCPVADDMLHPPIDSTKGTSLEAAGAVAVSLPFAATDGGVHLVHCHFACRCDSFPARTLPAVPAKQSTRRESCANTTHLQAGKDEAIPSFFLNFFSASSYGFFFSLFFGCRARASLFSCLLVSPAPQVQRIGGRMARLLLALAPLSH